MYSIACDVYRLMSSADMVVKPRTRRYLTLMQVGIERKGREREKMGSRGGEYTRFWGDNGASACESEQTRV